MRRLGRISMLEARVCTVSTDSIRSVLYTGSAVAALCLLLSGAKLPIHSAHNSIHIFLHSHFIYVDHVWCVIGLNSRFISGSTGLCSKQWAKSQRSRAGKDLRISSSPTPCSQQDHTYLKHTRQMSGLTLEPDSTVAHFDFRPHGNSPRLVKTSVKPSVGPSPLPTPFPQSG